QRTCILAAYAYGCGIVLSHFAGNRLEELPLPVAGDTGDADHLSCPYRKVDVAQRDGERRCRLALKVANLEQGRGSVDTVHRLAHDSLDLAADHHARERGGRFIARIAMADDLAMAQHRGAVAY